MRRDFSTVHHGERVTDARFSPASNTGIFASTGRDRQIAVWQCLPSLDQVCDIDRPVVSISTSTVPECVALDWRESIVVFGTVTGSLKVFSLEAEKLVHTLAGHHSIVTGVKQSPLNEFIWASASLDKNVRLFDLRAGTQAVICYAHHCAGVRALCWSPHGQWLLSGSESGSVKLNDVALTTTPLASLDAHSQRITDVTFHPHEFFLATASLDRTVRFWDGETFECVSQSSTLNSAPQRVRFNWKTSCKCLYAVTENEVRALTWEPYEQCAAVPCDAAHDTTQHRVFDIVQQEQELRVLSAIGANRIVIESAGTSDDPPYLQCDNCNVVHSSLEKNAKIRRSFHSNDSATSSDNSPTIDIRKSSARSLSNRAKKARSDTKSGGDSISLNVPLLAGESEVFRKRDKVQHSPVRIPQWESNKITAVEETFIVHQSKDNRLNRASSKASLSKPIDDDQTQRSKSNPRIAKVQPQPSLVPQVSPVPKSVAVVKASHPNAVPEHQGENSTVETPKIDDARAFFADLSAGSKTDVTLRQRWRAHQHIIRTWRADGVTRAVDAAMQVNDAGVAVDMINLLNRKCTLYTLDICASVLSRLPFLLTSRHDAHSDTTRKTLVQLRASPIYSIIRQPARNSIGVDVAHDDRREKAKQCRINLMKLGDDALMLCKQADQSSNKRRHLKEIALLVDSFK